MSIRMRRFPDERAVFSHGRKGFRLRWQKVDAMDIANLVLNPPGFYLLKNIALLTGNNIPKPYGAAAAVGSQ